MCGKKPVHPCLKLYVSCLARDSKLRQRVLAGQMMYTDSEIPFMDPTILHIPEGCDHLSVWVEHRRSVAKWTT